jgi:hypothetical protein
MDKNTRIRLSPSPAPGRDGAGGGPQREKPKLQSAIQECQAALQAMRKAEYGKWRGFYTKGDWLLDTPRTLLLAQAYLDKLEGRAVPENAIIRGNDAGFAYHMITAYQGTQAVQF